MSEIDKITLKDIETMIMILERFIRVSRKAERLLKQLGRSYGRGLSLSRDDFIRAVSYTHLTLPTICSV